MDEQATIIRIISEEARLDRTKISRSSTLKDLEIDSLDAMQIIFAIEKQFDIAMPDRDPQFDTESVDGLIVAVETELAKRAAAAAA